MGDVGGKFLALLFEAFFVADVNEKDGGASDVCFAIDGAKKDLVGASFELHFDFRFFTPEAFFDLVHEVRVPAEGDNVFAFGVDIVEEVFGSGVG